jgi:uncharacterized Fe-S cluster-containing protein
MAIREIKQRLLRGDAVAAEEVLPLMPHKNCGLCGFRSCAHLVEQLPKDPRALNRCLFLEEHVPKSLELLNRAGEVTYRDILDRDYDFVLDKFPDDVGPREHIILSNPINVERLGIKRGDILFGRPFPAGCPVQHVGVVVSEPDYFNGCFEWCIVGPQEARERGRDIGYYNIIAYEGLVYHTRGALEFGRRYFFMPHFCMLQVRHSGLINEIAKTADGGYRVRLEGVWLS